MSKPENVGFRARRGLGLAPWKSPYSGIPYQELWGKNAVQKIGNKLEHIERYSVSSEQQQKVIPGA